MMKFTELLFQPENLTWAWRKARRMYSMADGLYDQGELSDFELNLEESLLRIRRSFENGTFRPDPMRLLPQPKKPDENGKPQMRQSFQVSVRDQVAWIAIANALGPSIDHLMPAWSYGHRLYRAAWFDEDVDGDSRLSIGPYRHANGHMYRKFKHSWPLFRRHISLTARKMAVGRIDETELDEGERQALKQVEHLPYLQDSGFWSPASRDGRTLYYASIDLRKFYPSVSPESVLDGFDLHLKGFVEDERMRSIVRRMLKFRVSSNGLSEEVKSGTDPKTKDGSFGGIPTGLMAAGFLSNVAMLPVDLAINKIIINRRDIAHFRFVDDHVILAYNFDDLCQWIRDYERLLREKGIGAKIAENKFDPKPLKDLIWPSAKLTPVDQTKLYNDMKSECAIDGGKPTKLMTRTLAQVSTLAAADFDALTDPDKSQRLEQLEWLLLADIPDREIRADTRAAFAAGRIASLAPTLLAPGEELVEAVRRRGLLKSQKNKNERQINELRQISIRIAELEEEEEEARKNHVSYYFSLLLHAFVEHPDKVRLFIRLLDYSRVTGHDGLKDIADWMRAHREDDYSLLRLYLGAISFHVIARQLPQVADDCVVNSRLHAQRDAARRYLHHIAHMDFAAFIQTDRAPEFFQNDAITALAVGLNVASTTLRANHPDDEVASSLKRLAQRLLPLSWESGSQAWKDATGRSLGIWTHWAETTADPAATLPSPTWTVTAPHLNSFDEGDWNNLRRCPSVLPKSMWRALAEQPRKIRLDDGGWLYDAARNAPEEFATLPRSRHSVIKRVDALLRHKGGTHIPLVEWVTRTEKMDVHDPRAGEWTALEVLRQLVAPLSMFGSRIQALDALHPANVEVPSRWLDDPLVSEGRPEIWTWESWRHAARVGRQNTRLVPARMRIADFRFRQSTRIGAGGNAWLDRLYAIGQLLWGILRKDFTLPNAWNIRGQERAMISFIGRDMERLAVSSSTLAILEACLLPRNLETAFMPTFPGLFGIEPGQPLNDIEFDSPTIKGPDSFVKRIEAAQMGLAERQITVLHHHPRQLVPVHIGRLWVLAPENDGEDE